MVATVRGDYARVPPWALRARSRSDGHGTHRWLSRAVIAGDAVAGEGPGEDPPDVPGGLRVEIDLLQAPAPTGHASGSDVVASTVR